MTGRRRLLRAAVAAALARRDRVYRDGYQRGADDERAIAGRVPAGSIDPTRLHPPALPAGAASWAYYTAAGTTQ